MPMNVPTFILVFLSLFLCTGISAQSVKSTDAESTDTKPETYGKLQVSDTTVIVPNVFTPNDDAVNDDLEIISSGKFFISFKVFTRSGLLVYKTKAKTIKWDGRMDSGEKVAAGIYFYVLEMQDSDPPVSKKGFFYIFN